MTGEKLSRDGSLQLREDCCQPVLAGSYCGTQKQVLWDTGHVTHRSKAQLKMNLLFSLKNILFGGWRDDFMVDSKCYPWR